MFAGKKRKLRRELVARLERIRDAAKSGAAEVKLCRFFLDELVEQLEAAVAVGDYASADEIFAKIKSLLNESQQLLAREQEFENQLGILLSRMEKAQNG